MEIMFRAWDGKNMRTHDIGVLRDLIEYKYGSLSHKDYIFMRYTGIKDKSGKEIYEGDIVECAGRKRVVERIEEECRFNVVHYGKHLFKIIGNIYETPQEKQIL